MSVAVLTGGTSGLGLHVARGLARSHTLVLTARRPAPDAPEGAEIEPADLSLLADTRRAAARIRARHPEIRLLVLNAGCFTTRRETTVEGHERVLATNHLSPFVMLGALAPALAPGARVVFTGSSTADRARIDPADLELTHGWGLQRAYARSKLAQTITGLEWARRLEGVSVTIVHPGLVATGLVRAGGPIGWAWALLGRFALSAEQGAATVLRACLDPALDGVTGRYIVPGGFRQPNPRAADPALTAAVWTATERLAARPAPPAPAPPAPPPPGRDSG